MCHPQATSLVKRAWACHPSAAVAALPCSHCCQVLSPCLSLLPPPLPDLQSGEHAVLATLKRAPSELSSYQRKVLTWMLWGRRVVLWRGDWTGGMTRGKSSVEGKAGKGQSRCMLMLRPT